MSAKKRFYKSVTTATEDDGVAIHLDGRAVKTPAGSAVRLPTPALAGAVAAEWDDARFLAEILVRAQS